MVVVLDVLTAEFGNYIGGDLDSDDESDVEIAPAAAPSAPGPSAGATYAPLEGFDDDEEDEGMEEDEATGMEMTLHGVDGEGWLRRSDDRNSREPGCLA